MKNSVEIFAIYLCWECIKAKANAIDSDGDNPKIDDTFIGPNSSGRFGDVCNIFCLFPFS